MESLCPARQCLPRDSHVRKLALERDGEYGDFWAELEVVGVALGEDGPLMSLQESGIDDLSSRRKETPGRRFSDDQGIRRDGIYVHCEDEDMRTRNRMERRGRTNDVGRSSPFIPLSLSRISLFSPQGDLRTKARQGGIAVRDGTRSQVRSWELSLSS